MREPTLDWRRPAGRWALLLLLTSLIAGVAAALHFGAWQQTIDLAPDRIVAIGRHAYAYEFDSVDIPSDVFGRQSDNNANPRRSQLVLIEDSVLIGTSHSSHEDIRTLGLGQFSHWQVRSAQGVTQEALIFSASDNSDPRSNGRSYRARYAIEFGAIGIVAISMLSLVALAGFLWAVRSHLRRSIYVIGTVLLALAGHALQSRLWPVAVVGVASYVFWFFALAMPSVPLLNPDSHTYLTAGSIVPLGYWAYAKLVIAIGGVEILPAAQIGLWILSVFALYIALCAALRFRAIAAVCAIALLLLGTVTKYSMLALTETMFASSLILHISSVIISLKRATRVRLGMVALTAALVVLIRPAGLFVPVCTLLLFVYRFNQRQLVFVAMVLPMIISYAVLTIASSTYRNKPAQSLAWLALFPHVAHLYVAQDLPRPTSTAIAVEAALEDYRRELSAQPTAVDRALYSMNNFNRASASTQLALRSFGLQHREEMIPYFREYALSTVSSHPRPYLGHVSDHIFTAWWIHFPYAANTGQWLNEHFQAHQASHNLLARKLEGIVHVPQIEYLELVGTSPRTLTRDTSIIDGTLKVLIAIPLFGPAIAIFSLIALLASLIWGYRRLWLAIAGYAGAMMSRGHTAHSIGDGGNTPLRRSCCAAGASFHGGAAGQSARRHHRRWKSKVWSGDDTSGEYLSRRPSIVSFP